MNLRGRICYLNCMRMYLFNIILSCNIRHLCLKQGFKTNKKPQMLPHKFPAMKLAEHKGEGGGKYVNDT